MQLVNTLMKWFLLGLVLIVLVVVTTPVASAQGPVVRLHASKTYSPVCSGPAKPGTARCFAQVITNASGSPDVSLDLPYGYGPAQFHAAYNLPTSTSVNQIIAIVDAYDEPNMLSDLNTYSSMFGISSMSSCPVSSGSTSSPCFQKVDQNGGTNYPSVDSGWAEEIALDVEVAHTICQNCNILLVEANSNSYSDLFTAIDRARTMGSNIISNSWGGPESSGENTYDSHFNYTGIAFTFSTGDSGYGAQYPAASPYVTAVGGTTLNINADNSYNSESVWSGAGSGCSGYESKPSFQTDSGCTRRTIGDVSADADPNTGAAVYETATSSGGWFQIGGTSLAAPLIAGTYGLAGGMGPNMGNSIPYANGNSSNLHDVTSGSNGSCSPSYLCTGVTGYDGPTGLGTPNGTSAFSSSNSSGISNPNPADYSTVDRTTNITFYWSVSNATQCYVHFWGGPSIDINSNWISCSGWTIGQQWPGSYQWQVSARNGSTTRTGPIWHLYIRPYAPTNLSASAASQTQINLSWTKSSDDPGSVDNYKVYYSNDTYITTLSSGATNYTVGNLTCGTPYSFYVTAVRQGVESNPSNTSGATTNSCNNSPPNDDLNNATPISSMPYSTAEDTTNATTASDDPIFTCGSQSQGSASVWYRYTPTSNGQLTANTIGSNYDTMLAVWSGSRGNLTSVACDDDSGGNLTSALTATLTSGTMYYIEVVRYMPGLTGGGGSMNLSVTFTPTSGNVTVTSVWTGDASWSAKSTFNPGDSIVYIGAINNTTDVTQTAYFDWEITGPCGRIDWWQGNLSIRAGTGNWGLTSNIPNSACGGTYTYQLSVTYNGSTTTQATSFTISNPTVQAISVWTADANGNSKTVFNPNDGIRYVGKVYNGTVVTQTAYFVWSANGPCGSIASWSGNLDTGTGMWMWWLSTSVPINACGGNYTYQLSITYNSGTTSQSTNFVVQQLSRVYLPLLQKGGGASALTQSGIPTVTPILSPYPIGKPANLSSNIPTAVPSPGITPVQAPHQ